jgi:hypothetical protein
MPYYTVTVLSRMTEGEGGLSIRLEERGNDGFGQMARGACPAA